MSQPRSSLPPQPRLRSLARLEAEIVKTEAARTEWEAQAVSLEARGRDGRSVRALLRIAEDRLALLHGSRQVLLEGDAGRDAEPEAT